MHYVDHYYKTAPFSNKSKLILNGIISNMSHSVSQADSSNQAISSPCSVTYSSFVDPCCWLLFERAKVKTAWSHGEKGKLTIHLFRGLLMSLIIIFNIAHYNVPMGEHYCHFFWCAWTWCHHVPAF